MEPKFGIEVLFRAVRLKNALNRVVEGRYIFGLFNRTATFRYSALSATSGSTSAARRAGR